MKALGLLFIVLVLAATGLAVVRTLVEQPPAPAPKTETPMPTKTAPSLPKYSKSSYDVTPLTDARIEELAKKLTAEEKAIILSKGTERAFCGNLLDNHKDGVYVCRLCGLPLFSSDAKFNSGTGWPSFFQPFDAAHVTQIRDESLGMVRTEINCARCGGHLGHVFDDGPRPTGLRFCLNSASLEFVEKGQPMPDASKPVTVQTAYFAGGCFWGVEDRFQQLPGVIDAVSGYMGGKIKNPTYEQVCTHTTGHAETVKVTFDPARTSYKELLTYFFRIHNPTQLNRQGPDVGDNYRSAIFTDNEDQLKQARQFIMDQQASARFKGRTIVTQIQTAKDAGAFYAAEDYHQDYHMKHGGHCPIPDDE